MRPEGGSLTKNRRAAEGFRARPDGVDPGFELLSKIIADNPKVPEPRAVTDSMEEI
jgi:hypothetical protein